LRDLWKNSASCTIFTRICGKNIAKDGKRSPRCASNPPPNSGRLNDDATRSLSTPCLAASVAAPQADRFLLQGVLAGRATHARPYRQTFVVIQKCGRLGDFGDRVRRPLAFRLIWRRGVPAQGYCRRRIAQRFSGTVPWSMNSFSLFAASEFASRAHCRRSALSCSSLGVPGFRN
jgi:hypothetical protein